MHIFSIKNRLLMISAMLLLNYARVFIEGHEDYYLKLFTLLTDAFPTTIIYLTGLLQFIKIILLIC
ncbi:hypothetical protein T4D_5391 [Trichinella pseudospiralis]|uniref:Uncharacterized protein n=1 Tax=Trichinella pseudospiralis TaxID=6337 RepID=A0A0V1FYW9_TRIPS|nr:hypothetical protein T4D_5391 [Trichinella pseudospiralis]